MRRREFIAALGGAVAMPFGARAQQPPKVTRIGFLRYASPHEKQFNAFRDGLRALGYIEGQNIVIEQRYAAGALQRLGPLADELVRLIGYPTDPDLIGPFDTYEDAKAFTEAHPERCREAYIRCMATPAFEILCELEFKADRARFASKLGVTSDVLEPHHAPRDVTVEITATLAREVAQYLERNCPLPGVQEICALLKIATTTDCVVYPRDTPPPPELQPAA